MFLVDVVFVDKGSDFCVEVVDVEYKDQDESEGYTHWKDEELVEERVYQSLISCDHVELDEVEVHIHFGLVEIIHFNQLFHRRYSQVSVVEVEGCRVFLFRNGLFRPVFQLDVLGQLEGADCLGLLCRDQENCFIVVENRRIRNDLLCVSEELLGVERDTVKV